MTNIIALVTALLTCGLIDVSSTVLKVLSIITFVSTLTVWLKYGEKAQNYLEDNRNLQVATEVCQSVQVKLSQIAEDGLVTSTEHDEIVDAMALMIEASESISVFSTFATIFGSNMIAEKGKDAMKVVRNVGDVISKKVKRISDVHGTAIKRRKYTQMTSG